MSNKKTNLVQNFVQNLVNSQQQGEIKMKNLDTQEQLEATTYKNEFYDHYFKNIDNANIQRLILLANRILITSTKIASDFKISIGYKALMNQTNNSNKISNDFRWLHNQKIEDIGYCFANPQEFQDAQLYFILKEKEAVENILLTDVGYIEGIRNINFLETLKTKINLLDLILKNSCFEGSLKYYKLLNYHFKFDVKYDQNYEMQNTSTLKIIFHLLDDASAVIPILRTYIWRYDLKAFVCGLPVEPKLKVFSVSVEKMAEIDFANL